MADTTITDGSEDDVADTGVIADLATASQSYGPKRVKTPNMEVEQFDPLTIQRAEDRANSVYPTLCNMGMTIVSPNSCVYRRPRKTR